LLFTSVKTPLNLTTGGTTAFAAARAACCAESETAEQITRSQTLRDNFMRDITLLLIFQALMQREIRRLCPISDHCEFLVTIPPLVTKSETQGKRRQAGQINFWMALKTLDGAEEKPRSRRNARPAKHRATPSYAHNNSPFFYDAEGSRERIYLASELTGSTGNIEKEREKTLALG
jgi:hypothetical protein